MPSSTCSDGYARRQKSCSRVHFFLGSSHSVTSRQGFAFYVHIWPLGAASGSMSVPAAKSWYYSGLNSENVPWMSTDSSTTPCPAARKLFVPVDPRQGCWSTCLWSHGVQPAPYRECPAGCGDRRAGALSCGLATRLPMPAISPISTTRLMLPQPRAGESFDVDRRAACYAADYHADMDALGVLPHRMWSLTPRIISTR